MVSGLTIFACFNLPIGLGLVDSLFLYLLVRNDLCIDIGTRGENISVMLMVEHGLLSYPSMASPSFKKLAMEESQKPATIIRHGRYLATLKYIWKKVSRYIDFL
jgi:hypothetical protein